MSNKKYTKGKWKIREELDSAFKDYETNIIAGRTRIAEVKHYNDGKDERFRNDPLIEEGKANALLISKAPEMLEMLEKVVKLEPIICIGGAVGEQWMGEQEALSTMMEEIKQLIKSATELELLKK